MLYGIEGEGEKGGVRGIDGGHCCRRRYAVKESEGGGPCGGMSEIKVSLFRWLGGDHPDIHYFRGAKRSRDLYLCWHEATSLVDDTQRNSYGNKLIF